jgi:hypothetical protein
VRASAWQQESGNGCASSMQRLEPSGGPCRGTTACLAGMSYTEQIPVPHFIQCVKCFILSDFPAAVGMGAYFACMYLGPQSSLLGMCQTLPQWKLRKTCNTPL